MDKTCIEISKRLNEELREFAKACPDLDLTEVDLREEYDSNESFKLHIGESIKQKYGTE